ncbi:hypothetical protein IL306_014806 [Fusarium sp. DS 682]|nr:hypothetical protein IL306_014806 [Fusarium sp. DS 682]
MVEHHRNSLNTQAFIYFKGTKERGKTDPVPPASKSFPTLLQATWNLKTSFRLTTSSRQVISCARVYATKNAEADVAMLPLDSDPDLNKADVALKFRADLGSANITDEQRRRVLKKIDLYLLPYKDLLECI